MTRRPAPPSRWLHGWHPQARRVPSPNFGGRPSGSRITLAVVHSISLPPGVYGGDAIERLFTNTLPTDEHPYYAGLAGLQVSAHFLIRRDGALVQFVGVNDRAWHAGASSWAGRANCNDYSVGIELEGLEGDAFEAAQYDQLADLLGQLARRWPIRDAVGHEHVAPGRKQDPGPGFDWQRLREGLRDTPVRLPAFGA
jgi:AmpD protein